MDFRLRGNDGRASCKGSGVNFFTRSQPGIHFYRRNNGHAPAVEFGFNTASRGTAHGMTRLKTRA
jgi:hypothetical protein